MTHFFLLRTVIWTDADFSIDQQAPSKTQVKSQYQYQYLHLNMLAIFSGLDLLNVPVQRRRESDYSETGMNMRLWKSAIVAGLPRNHVHTR